jgi:hypothetical protein
MDGGSTDEADAGKVTRWAEGCRRHKAIRQLVERHKQPLPKSVVEDVALGAGGQPSASAPTPANIATIVSAKSRPTSEWDPQIRSHIDG